VFLQLGINHDILVYKQVGFCNAHYSKDIVYHNYCPIREALWLQNILVGLHLRHGAEGSNEASSHIHI
jgi:hypothetical protein